MIAAETEQGLTRLGVLFENTLVYSPYQNGKQEVFWGPNQLCMQGQNPNLVQLAVAHPNDPRPQVHVLYA